MQGRLTGRLGRQLVALAGAVLGVLVSTAGPARAQIIAGDWSYTDSGSFSCNIGGTPQGGPIAESGTIHISQSGSNVSWSTLAPGVGRSGTITDGVVRVSGLLGLVVSGVTSITFTANSYAAQGVITETATTRQITLSGFGSASGNGCTAQGCAAFSCTAQDQATFSQPKAIWTAKLGPFVTGFYTEILARQPAEQELSDWISFLLRHPVATGSTALVAGFFNSDENLHQPTTLNEYVTRLYQTILQREPSAAEAQAWVDVALVPAMNTLVPGFVNSAEFQQLLRTTPATDVLTRFYRLVLGREPDAAGLAGWNAFLARTGDWMTVTTGFLDSAEYVAGERSFAEHVAILYRTFLGREPDAAGLQGWLAILTTQLSSIQSGFTQSPEFQQRIEALFR